jgi:signal transduction histidine kinase
MKVSKNLSRQEIKNLLQNESLYTIYLTAFVFVCAGSLWTHFTLRQFFWHPPLFFSWLGINILGLLALKYPTRASFHLNLGLIVFQAYCYCLLSQGLPFLPLAPLFFSTSTLCLLSTWRWSLKQSMFFWALIWASALSWSKPYYWQFSEGRSAVVVTLALHASFHLGFALMALFYSRQQKQHLENMFGKVTFDTQRLHAGRLQMLGELSASLSHEISSSLINIHGYHYQLEEEFSSLGESNSIIKNSIERLGKNIDHVMNVVRALKSFSRKESVQVEQKFSLKELVQECVELTKEHLKIAKVNFSYDINFEDCELQGSKVELQQVLINFIINARDACLKSPIKKVTLKTENKENNILITISDTGGGVNPEIAGKIFEPFFTTKTSTSGTGLGLYLSKMIAQRQNSELSFTNLMDEAGHYGAAFCIKIPKAINSSKAAA